MRIRHLKRFGPVAALIGALLVASPARAAVEIQWWHAMAGELGRQLEQLAADFNGQQPDYKIVPVYKGQYTETMTAALFALRTGQHPAIVQVNEVATATMMAAKGAAYPVHQLMREQGEAFDPAAYLPAITGYYADIDGNMLSFPFNASTPILYYNKDQFRLAGLDAEKPPATWPEVEAAAQKLRAAGVPCGVTTAWPSWINVENLSAFHNVPLATKQNGFGGLDTELLINNELVVRHIAALAEWQHAKIFDYGGRSDRADQKFYGSQCGIYISSSATRADILANAKFEVGFGMMPYWPDIAGAPQNSIIGGATLWVLKGRPAEEYKGVARFFAYLSKPGAQAWWHQTTGYLPITKAAYELSQAQGFYDRNPGADISIKQITLHTPTDNSKGLRLGSFVLIRDIIEDELEQAFAGKRSAKSALDLAVKRGNDVLRQFEKANR
ncbi:MAG: sn-glycerol 3-phosphate transport system substrate-binding protein [Hyphomicrobiales bacterium]|nr:sn-glycerol 3-phosphate transport system substrate-binding protein [Hyphomicrobiales bacterium]